MSTNMAHPILSKATQFARFLRVITDAAAVNFDRRNPKELIELVTGQTKKLTQYLGLLLEALENNQEIVLRSPEFRSVGIIRFGSYAEARSLRNAVEAAGCIITQGANDIILGRNFSISQQHPDLEIVEVSGAELGFTKPVTRSQIYLRATKLSFGLCTLPLEAGPLIAITYTQIETDQGRFVATEPFADDRSAPNLFIIGRAPNEDRKLLTYYAYGNKVYDPANLWLFGRDSKG
jgi:hypothetical protein